METNGVEYVYARVVKSTSSADSMPSAFSQVQEAKINVSISPRLTNSMAEFITGNVQEGRLPQAQVSPVTALFSDTERSQVHWPTGRAPMKIN